MNFELPWRRIQQPRLELRPNAGETTWLPKGNVADGIRRFFVVRLENQPFFFVSRVEFLDSNDTKLSTALVHDLSLLQFGQ